MGQSQTDLESRLGVGARLRRSVTGVLARVWAGGLHAVYGYLAYLARQLLPDTAEGEWLARWASIWGVARKAATYASGPVQFAGQAEAVVPADTRLQLPDGSAEYTTDAELILDGSGAGTVSVTAAEAGAGGNAEGGATLELVSPVAGVRGEATVGSDGLTGGTDTEDDESLRERLLLRIRRPPAGGNVDDYIRWAREVDGVTRAWCYPLEQGAGTVVVRFMMDDAYSDGIPQSGDVDTVQAYLDDRAPATATVYAVAPVAVALDPVIQIDPNTTTVQEAVTEALRDLIRREGQPGGTLLHSRIHEAISLAPGEEDHTLESPTDDVSHGTGEIPVLGSPTYKPVA